MNEIGGEGNELFLNYTLYTILLSLLQREIEKLSFKLLHSYDITDGNSLKFWLSNTKKKKKGYWNIIYFQTLSSKKRKKKKNKVKKRLIPIP